MTRKEFIRGLSQEEKVQIIKEYKDGTSRICFVLVADESLEIAQNILKKAIELIKIETI